MQFGFDQRVSGSNMTATLPVRNTATALERPGVTVDVSFRPDAPGVVDIQRLERSLHAAGGTGVDAVLDSAEYALQLIRFPYRQIYGRADAPRPNTDVVLQPTIRYTTLATTLFINGVTPP